MDPTTLAAAKSYANTLALGNPVEFQKSATHLQWRQVGGDTWTDLVALTDITGAPGAAGTGSIIGADGETYLMVSGVLRNTGAGWAQISDAGHSPVNIGTVVTFGAPDNKIHIPYSIPAGKSVAKVVSCAVTVDEALSQAGFFVGASVATSALTVYLSRVGWAQNARVVYDGAEWAVTNAPSAIGVTVMRDPAFSSFDGARMTVTGVTIDADEPALVTSRSAYHAKPNTPVGNQQTVEFYNAGTRVSVADTSMDFSIQRGFGAFLADPTTVTTTTYPDSNIWLQVLLLLA